MKLIYDRRSVGQSVLVSGSQPEPMTRFLFSVWQLRVFWCGAPSLTRGWVCNLIVQLLLGLARAVTLGSKSHRTQSHLRLPQPGGPVPRIYIPQEQSVPVIPPGSGFPIHRLLLLAGLRLRYSISPPHGLLAIVRSFTIIHWISTLPNESPLECALLWIKFQNQVTVTMVGYIIWFSLYIGWGIVVLMIFTVSKRSFWSFPSM
jgi:hypothetical protein